MKRRPQNRSTPRTYIAQPPFLPTTEWQRYRDAGHSDEWIKWYLSLPAKMNKQQQAKNFIISMKGPAADRFAKKYLQLKFWKEVDNAS